MTDLGRSTERWVLVLGPSTIENFKSDPQSLNLRIKKKLTLQYVWSSKYEARKIDFEKQIFIIFKFTSIFASI